MQVPNIWLSPSWVSNKAARHKVFDRHFRFLHNFRNLWWVGSQWTNRPSAICCIAYVSSVSHAIGKESHERGGGAKCKASLEVRQSFRVKCKNYTLNTMGRSPSSEAGGSCNGQECARILLPYLQQLTTSSCRKPDKLMPRPHTAFPLSYISINFK
jgi:hypothetical protein